MPKKHIYLLSAIILAGMALAFLSTSHATVPAAIPAPNAATQYSVVAPGLVEPANEERQIGSEVIGIVREVLVDENDPVKVGQIIATIKNDDQVALVAQTKAQLAAATASFVEAEKSHKRNLLLVKSNSVAITSVEVAKKNLDMATAEMDRITALAQQAQANLDKTIIRSPIDGVVLKKQITAGAAVSNQPPTPIAIVGDVAELRVRAEVDELDIGRLHQGQRVDVKADAFPDLKVSGTIVRVNKRLGSRQVQTDRSNERADSKVLQTLIALDNGVSLPIGLRVDVFFKQPD